ILRSKWRARCSAHTTRSWRRPLDEEHQLEAVDLVYLRPDLHEAEAANDGERRRVVRGHRGVHLLLAAAKSPAHERARGLLRVALAAELLEHRVADLGAADHLRRSVEPAVADGLTGGRRAHEACRPRAALWRRPPALELGGGGAVAG